MLCPLRHRIKSSTFEECYKEKCEWWIEVTNEEMGEVYGQCSITHLALYYISKVTKIKARVIRRTKNGIS